MSHYVHTNWNCEQAFGLEESNVGVHIAVTSIAWVRYSEMVYKSQYIQYMKDFAGIITLKFIITTMQ